MFGDGVVDQDVGVYFGHYVAFIGVEVVVELGQGLREGESGF